MSPEGANPGITEVPRAVFQPLPPVTDDLHVVHYASAPRSDGYAPAPPVAAIVVKHVLSGVHMTFPAISAGEAIGIRPDEFLTRFPQLEREMLETFTNYVTSRSSAMWVHWRMRDAIFGFDVLTQRAVFHRVRLHAIPVERRFDLSYHLARRYGDEFAPRPRLWNACRRNLGDLPDLLDEAASAAAWERGDHAAVLRSLNAKVDAVTRLFERTRVGKFISGEGGPYQGSDQSSPPVGPPGNAAIIQKHRRVAPGPDIVLHPEVLDPSFLTERHCTILDHLLSRQAFDRATSETTEAVAVGVDGPKGKKGAFKRPVSNLQKWGLVGTVDGCNGGVWLTPSGRAIAEGRRTK